MRPLPLASILLLALSLGACAQWRPTDRIDTDPGAGPQPGQVSPEQLPSFSTASLSHEIPEGWREWRLHPTKRLTKYRLVRDGDQIVLRADAERSASGLVAPVRFDASKRSTIRWRWKIDELVEEADSSEAATEDAPCRIVLAFDGDKSKLPFRDQMFFERVQLLSGHDMPYATLMYIWGNKEPVESIIMNPHTRRVRKLVVSTGDSRARQWVEIQRDYVEDFRRVYGEEPGKLLAVSIMTDTDNTGDTVRAWYGDIQLLPSGESRR